MIGIGSTVYIYEGNRRRYTSPDGTKRSTSDPYYHYRPLEIVGETRLSWVAKTGEKINKRTGEITGGGSFGRGYRVLWTWQEVEDGVYVEKNRIPLADRVLACTDRVTLERVAAVLNGEPDASQLIGLLRQAVAEADACRQSAGRDGETDAYVPSLESVRAYLATLEHPTP